MKDEATLQTLCARCGQNRAMHWATSEGYPVCPELVRADAMGEPEWKIEVVLAENNVLRAEVDRLRDGITRHRRAKTPKTPEARRFHGLPNMADQSLWALIGDDASDNPA